MHPSVGEGPGTPMDTTPVGTPPPLPGVGPNAPTQPPPYGPPGTEKPTSPPAPVPAFWQDPVRIIRAILDLWEKSPKDALEAHAFVQAKLAKIAQEKRAT